MRVPEASRAFAGALALGLDHEFAYVAGANASYWHAMGVGFQRAVDYGIRDAQAAQRRRDIERQLCGEAA